MKINYSNEIENKILNLLANTEDSKSIIEKLPEFMQIMQILNTNTEGLYRARSIGVGISNVEEIDICMRGDNFHMWIPLGRDKTIALIHSLAGSINYDVTLKPIVTEKHLEDGNSLAT